MENSIHFFKNSTPRKILPPPRIPWGGQKNFRGGICPPPKTPKRRPCSMVPTVRYMPLENISSDYRAIAGLANINLTCLFSVKLSYLIFILCKKWDLVYNIASHSLLSMWNLYIKTFFAHVFPLSIYKKYALTFNMINVKRKHEYFCPHSCAPL